MTTPTEHVLASTNAQWSRTKVLLVSTERWFSAARLGMAFSQAGCVVDAVCSPQHPLRTIKAIAHLYRYGSLRPTASVRRAIFRARPTLIVPCDDRATWTLHRLYEDSEWGSDTRWLRSVIEMSLGAPMHYRALASRAQTLAGASEVGVRVPATVEVESPEGLVAWGRSHGHPIVLKADGTSGGRGIRIIGPGEERVAWRKLSAPPSLRRAVKRAAINRDTSYIRPLVCRTRGVVSAQAFVAGEDANALAACWQGRVLASISVLVLKRFEPNGPASVIRVIDHPGIAEAIQRVVARFCLSGLVGLDFVVERSTGNPYLIEVNPRATQIGHLRASNGLTLAGVLSAQLSSYCEPSLTAGTPGVVALFPQEWLRDPKSDFLRTAYHDVPWDEPGLIRACVAEDARVRAWMKIASATVRGRTRLRDYTSKILKWPGRSPRTGAAGALSPVGTAPGPGDASALLDAGPGSPARDKCTDHIVLHEA